ncbi:TPA: autotransporter outer membrane beta-barrel domain-containing protein [Salmonella enterica subsp. enterica serovar Hvittingfoss]|nr:autotransporter outer membrane beta-barrel domain-containing protein [Salmonella enterica subsp. enterica serovar Hvittingfoss]
MHKIIGITALTIATGLNTATSYAFGDKTVNEGDTTTIKNGEHLYVMSDNPPYGNTTSIFVNGGSVEKQTTIEHVTGAEGPTAPLQTILNTTGGQSETHKIFMYNRTNRKAELLINNQSDDVNPYLSTSGDFDITVGDKGFGKLYINTNDTNKQRLLINGNLRYLWTGSELEKTIIGKDSHTGLGETEGKLRTRELSVNGEMENIAITTDSATIAGSIQIHDNPTANTVVIRTGESETPKQIAVTRTGHVIATNNKHGKTVVGLMLTGEPDQKATLVNDGEITTTGNVNTNNEKLLTAAVVAGNADITNNGTITSDMYAIAATGGGTTITNNGEMTGMIAYIPDDNEDAMTEIKNSGTWNLLANVNPNERNANVQNTTVNNTGIITTEVNKEATVLHVKTLENSGEIDIRGSSLEIDGSYEGKDGKIRTRTVLGGDDSDTTRLTINGNAQGKTYVAVENAGGSGAATVDGITLVSVKGTDTSEFLTEGRIAAGAYDYTLDKYVTTEGTDWRLSSEYHPDPGPTPGPTPGPAPKPVHKFRPEAVAYAENMRQANTLFLTDSDQRQAVGEYTDPVTGLTETSSLWLSQTGGHSIRHDASGQLKSDYDRYVVQLGGTVLSLPAGDDGRLEAGVQAGYGLARGNSRSGLTGYRARGTLSGYSTGIYGTWRQHREGQSGAYVSTTLQYSWLKNQVKGDDLAAEKYDTRGTTLSLEGGYDLAVWQDGAQNGDSLFIRPRVQVTRMGVKADEHREANGTRVSLQGDGNVFSRTGVRMWLDKAVTKTQRVQPFVEANWLHNTRDFCSSMNGVRDCLAGNRDQAEVLAGVTGDVSRNVAVTAQAGGQFGSKASRDLSGTLNVSVKF